MQKRTIATVIFLIVFSSILISVHAIETIELEGAHRTTRSMNLVSGDSVTGTLTCIDNEVNYTNPIDFWIVDPDGNIIASYGATLGTSFSFVAEKDGTYIMHFRNGANIYSYTVARFTIDYSINNSLPPPTSVFSDNTPYIITTIVASSLAVIFAFLAFRRNKKPPPPPVAISTNRALPK